VITAIPNYPSGRVYPSYSAAKLKRESINNISVTHCPIYPSHDSRASHRMLNYLSFSLSALFFGWKVARKSDLILVYCSPATAAIPALFFRLLFGKPIVLYIQDLWPEAVTQTGLIKSSAVTKLLKFVLRIYDRVMLRFAEHIVVISDGVKQEIIRRGVAEQKISRIFNWTNEDVVFPRQHSFSWRKKLKVPDEARLFMYAGNIGKAQNLIAWIYALAQLQMLRDLHFVFIGEGTEKANLQKICRKLQLDRIYFFDPFPLSEYCVLASEVDVQVISLAPEETFASTIPGKVQTCLALASPIVATVNGDTRKILEDSNSAWVSEPGNQEEIVQMLLNAYHTPKNQLKKMGINGRKYYLATMSSKVGLNLLGQVLSNVMGEPANE
jgi:colanic acid biosynthesis glycosyl transferase WcaI